MAASDLPDVAGDQFRDALSRWASGVTVVTAAGADGPTGITASSFASLSLEPPLVLVCVGSDSGAHDDLCGADAFGVHLLARGQTELSNTFASQGIDKFAEVDHEFDTTGVPLLPIGRARLVCARHDAVPAGDHTVLMGRVVSVELSDDDDGEPLLFSARSYGRFQPD